MVFEFEGAAMRGDPLPRGMDLADQTAYIALRYLYAQHRAGNIGRDAASAEKREIVRAWEAAKRQCGLSAYSAEFFRAVEWYATDYRKLRTVEAADRLVDAVDGMLRGVPDG